MPLLTLALLVCGVLFGRLARGWVTARMSERSQAEARDEIALEDEKQRLLTTLRDLEFEHHMGKLSDADYESLRARFELRAVEVIEELEVLAS